MGSPDWEKGNNLPVDPALNVQRVAVTLLSAKGSRGQSLSLCGGKQMQDTGIRVSVVCLTFLILVAFVAAEPVRVVGTIQDVDGFSLSGKITVIQERPQLKFTIHEVGKDGLFKFTSDSEGSVVLHAAAIGYASAEHLIDTGTTGTVTVNFLLPLAQDVQVKVIDAEGNPVAGADLRIRYHEPEKPMRRISFDRVERTDDDGRFLLHSVGIQVPFVVDVLAPNYAPVSSKLTKLEEGDTQMDDVVLGAPGATVVVELMDDKGISPVPDQWVTLLADPAGLAPEDRDSWLHYRAFRQRAVTSSLGIARFTEVPPGRVFVRVKTETGSAKAWADAVSNQETWVSLRLP